MTRRLSRKLNVAPGRAIIRREFKTTPEPSAQPMKFLFRHFWVLPLAYLALGASEVRADILELENGFLEGEVLEETEFSVKVKTRMGTIEVPASNIKSIQKGKVLLDLYREKWIETDHKDLNERVKLALWARQNGLEEEAVKELQRVIAIDPDHPSARRQLGYEKFNGKWMPSEEAKQAKGLVQHKGKWVTPQKRDEIIASTQLLNTSIRVEDLFRKMRQAKPFERDALLQELYEVQTPQAAHYIGKHLKESDPDLRSRAIMALGRLKDEASVPALVKHSMEDPDKEVRRQAAVAMGQIRSAETLNLLVPLLADKDKIVRIRSAKALGSVGDARAIPALIQSLYVKIRTVSETDPFKKDEGSTAITATVGEDGEVTMNNDPVINKSTTMNTLGMGAQKPEDNEDYDPNPAAVAALVKITGQDFQYEKAKWLAWWEAHKDDLLDEKG